MMVILTGLLVALGSLVAMFCSTRWYVGAVVMMAVSLLMCFASFFFSKELALKMNGARIITEFQNPRLYGIVREVSQKAGLPMPEVGISVSPMPNAFATGRSPKNAAVVATQGLLDILPDDELRGVIAHEMSHVRNRDILVMSIVSAISMMISYITRMLMWMAIFSDRDSQEKLALTAIALASEILLPIAAMMVQLGISRNREFLADETGARLINDPRALARALAHLEKGIERDANASYRTNGSRENNRHDPAGNPSYAHMWIASPMKKNGIMRKLFSTHPPMEERIARLNKLADEMGL